MSWLLTRNNNLTRPRPKWWFMWGKPPNHPISGWVAELGRQIGPRSPAMVLKVPSQAGTSSVIVVEAFFHGMMLGHALLLNRVFVTGDWINAKCSVLMVGGGAVVLEMDEEAFASLCMAYYEGSLERALALCAGSEAMGHGLAYAGIMPILEVEWMPMLQVLRLQDPQMVIERDSFQGSATGLTATPRCCCFGSGQCSQL